MVFNAPTQFAKVERGIGSPARAKIFPGDTAENERRTWRSSPGPRWAEIRNLIDGSVPSATSGYIAVTAFAKAVQKYQFGHYDEQCLLCGAKIRLAPGPK